MPAAFYIGSNQRNKILPRLWYFLTHILQLKPENLWISYLNDPQLGIDRPTYACWKSLNIDEKRLIGLDRQHNFWQQRQLGQIARDGKKCGPHSEVFYERPEIHCQQCEASPHLALTNSCHCGRFVEISNSLFIENYINSTGKLIAADTVFSECVIGAERLAMILQAVPNVHRIAKYANWHHILENRLPAKQSPKYNQSIDIIVDHLAAFIRLVEDGAPEPGRGGQARIMRNLARGAITQAILWDIDLNNILTLLLSKYVETQSEYGSTQSLQRLQNEVSRFNRTLERATKQMRKMLKNTVLTENIKKELQQKWGLPPILSEKFYTMLSIKA